MTTKLEKELFLKSFKEFITTTDDFYGFVIRIPHHGNSIGFDTTKLYTGALTSIQKNIHGLYAGNSLKKTIHSDAHRKLRQQDVAVSAVSELSEKFFICQINKEYGSFITLQKKPVKIIKKNLDKICEYLDVILSFVTSSPELLTSVPTKYGIN